MELKGEPVKMLDPRMLSELLTNNIDEDLFPTLFLMTPNGVLIAYSTPVNVPQLRQQAALLGKGWFKVEAAVAKNAHGPAPVQVASTSNAADFDVKKRFDPSFIATPKTLQDGDLEVLTMPYPNCNFIVKAVQPGILAGIIGMALKEPDAEVPKSTYEVRGAANNPLHPAAHLNLKMYATPTNKNDPTTDGPSTNDANAAKDVASEAVKGKEPEGGVEGQDSHVTEGAEAAEGEDAEDDEIPVPEEIDNAYCLMITRIRLDGVVDYIRNEFEKEGFTMPTDADVSQITDPKSARWWDT